MAVYTVYTAQKGVTYVEQDRLWQAVLGDIEITLSRGNYLTWFKNTQLLKHSPDKLVIGVPNVFIKQQLERKYHDLVTETLLKNGVNVPLVEYKIQSVARKPEADDIITLPSPTGASEQYAQPAGTKISNSLAHAYRLGLNERYTFENFVVGSGNELAYAACQSIAANPGTRYNPLFLYGGVGIGKTHLIQAVGNAVLAGKPSARVVYVSTEQFVQEFVDALRYKKNTDFADFYRGADVLIVDDVQFLAGKEKIQEEFFHTFNALHQANKQIIISSDKPPREIPTLEERLRSRFVWGMSIDMQNPDFETRCAILQIKSEGHHIQLPNDVVDYLATNVSTNIRELEGALNQLLAFCEMRALEPNLAEAYAARAYALMIDSHPEAAAVAFEKALALDPNCYEANQLYAEFFVTKGDFEQAAEHYLRAMEIRPDDYQAPLFLSGVLQSLGRPGEAAKYARPRSATSRRGA